MPHSSLARIAASTSTLRATAKWVIRLLPLSLVGLVACSFVVSSKADQCSTNADCTARGSAFAGMVCSAQHVCVDPNGGGGEKECSTSAECIAKQGDNHICRKSDFKCVSLLSDECTRVVGDYADDGAIFIGSLAPVKGDDATLGIALQDSVELALSDFTQAANGLPPSEPGGATRPLVMIGCSDDSDGDVAVRAAQHLVSTVQVPAIIGSAFSGITTKVATKVTIPGGTLLISPSATSVTITDLNDNGLVWRTAPSDLIQADALVKLMPQLEADVRQRVGLASGESIRVAMLNKGDSYGKGLAAALVNSLSFNGKLALENDSEDFSQFNYGNPDDAQVDPPKYAEAVAHIIEQLPHIVMLFGAREAVTDVFAKVEEQWPSTAPHRPFYVFSDGGEVSELWDFLLNNDPSDSARKRVIGTVPGTNNANYKTFRNLYNATVSDGSSPDVFGTAGAYDSVYLLAYSAATVSGPITGTALSQGMGKLVPPGNTIKVGGAQINQAFSLLQSGQSIDFDGASGQLNFDLSVGEAPSDIQFWCHPKGANGKVLSGTNSGAYYDATSQSVASDALATLMTACKF